MWLSPQNSGWAWCGLIALGFSLATPSKAELGTELTLAYSDNLDRLETGGRSDRVLAAVIGGRADGSYGDLERTATWQLGGLSYLDETFDDEPLVGVDATGEFALLDRRITWQILDRLGRQSLNPFGATTPDTREHVNFFSTGPQFLLPVARNLAFDAALGYSDVWYEEQTLANNRSDSRFGLRYGLGLHRSLGLYVSENRVRFDESDLHDDYTLERAYIAYDSERSRGDIRIALGVSAIEGLGERLRASLVEVTWSRTVAVYGNLNVEVRRDFSDAGSLFQLERGPGSAIDVVQNIQAVSDPLKLTHASAVYSMTRERTTASLGFRWSRYDYENSVRGVNFESPTWEARFTREATSRLLFEAALWYYEQRFIDSDRNDSERHSSAGIGWRLGQRSTVRAHLARLERKSNRPGLGYDENRFLLSFGYGTELAGLETSRL
jgi:hypothetical protein